MSNDKTTDLKNEVKKLTMIQSAKDKAVQEAGYNTFNELISVDGYLSDNITLINRAMEIYAEGERTEGIREGFEAARLTLIQEGRNCGDLYPTVDDYLNSKK